MVRLVDQHDVYLYEEQKLRAIEKGIVPDRVDRDGKRIGRYLLKVFFSVGEFK